VAQPRIPPIEDLLRDPDAYIQQIAKLPTPLVVEVENQLKALHSRLGSNADVPATPVEMAIRNPRYKWMDVKHLRFLGEVVAQAVEFCEPTIVCMPPRNAKTTTCSVWTPFWALARNPELSILFITYEANFARRWGLRVRQLVELYGHEYGLKLNPRQTAADNWETEQGGGMQTVGAGGGVSGKAAGLLICDDLVKDDEAARSEILREKLWQWWDNTAVQRIEPDTGVFIIGTRWHEDDIIGRLLEHSKDGSGVKFNLVSLPALAIENDPLGRTPGDPLWPEHFSKDWLERRKRDQSPYVWSAVYQQSPSPPGGNMVDPDWWRFYRLSELPGEFDDMCQSWDLGLDSEKRSDSYHCGGVFGRKGAIVFVLDVWRAHCGIDGVIAKIMEWSKVYPKARTKLIERSLAGPALAQMLRSRVGGMTPWPPKGSRKESKEACLQAIVPDIRSGNVVLPLTLSGNRPHWVEEFIEELRQFPRAAHDDQVDVASQGVGFLLPSARQNLAAAHDEALATQPPESPIAQHNKLLHDMIAKLGKPRLDALRRAQERADRGMVTNLRIDTASLREKPRVGAKLW